MTKKLTRGQEKRLPGRPSIPDDEKQKYVRMSMQLPEDIHSALKDAARRTNRTVTGYIVHALEIAMQGDK